MRPCVLFRRLTMIELGGSATVVFLSGAWLQGAHSMDIAPSHCLHTQGLNPTLSLSDICDASFPRPFLLYSSVAVFRSSFCCLLVSCMCLYTRSSVLVFELDSLVSLIWHNYWKATCQGNLKNYWLSCLAYNWASVSACYGIGNSLLTIRSALIFYYCY
jgi:hypothetical protein